MSKYVKDEEWGTKYPNFQKSEFKCPCGKCNGYGNGIATTLVETLQEIRNARGKVTITSGYRCPTYNKQVGGVSQSKHMDGQAADFYVEGFNDQNNRIAMVNDLKRGKYYHYSYCNVNGNFPNMGNVVHLDTLLVDPDQPVTPATDNAVFTVQKTLNERYGYQLTVDGIYGQDTHKKLVMALQTEFNKQFGAKLNVDGIFGPATKGACVIVKKGHSGNITWLIQAMLQIKGYDTNGLDGIFGSGTEQAVKDFQKAVNISIDGIVGKETFEKLFA